MDDYRAKYEALLAACRELPGVNSLLTDQDMPDIVRQSARNQRRITDYLTELGERFMVHWGYENWSENVIARMTLDPRASVRGTNQIDAMEQAKRGPVH